jgi:hypothetical protein
LEFFKLIVLRAQGHHADLLVGDPVALEVLADLSKQIYRVFNFINFSTVHAADFGFLRDEIFHVIEFRLRKYLSILVSNVKE